MPVEEIKSYEQFKSIIDGDKPVVINFGATWCGPCKVISPVLAQFSDLLEFAKVRFYKVDIDSVPNVAEEVQIRVVPTFMTFKDGNKIDEVSGANPQLLKDFITKAANI